MCSMFKRTYNDEHDASLMNLLWCKFMKGFDTHCELLCDVLSSTINATPVCTYLCIVIIMQLMHVVYDHCSVMKSLLRAVLGGDCTVLLVLCNYNWFIVTVSI